jgi:hypothetical protein
VDVPAGNELMDGVSVTTPVAWSTLVASQPDGPVYVIDPVLIAPRLAYVPPPVFTAVTVCGAALEPACAEKLTARLDNVSAGGAGLDATVRLTVMLAGVPTTPEPDAFTRSVAE